MSRIVITLKSDLCVASGQSFSSVVDSDIATDSFGLPYIPARRIKGCLRDAATYIQSTAIDELFGESGKSDSGRLKIGNGYLEDSKILEAEIAGIKGISAQRVTELFTDIKAQTSIEGDTVKDSSLRFTRVLSHYLPYDTSRETTFVFEIAGVPDDKKVDFEQICKALRHIGLMRTRGLGFVKAKYNHDFFAHSNAKTKVFEGKGVYYLPLHLLLTEPLLIASRDNTECMNYVPGTAVLGAFARLAVLSRMDEMEFDQIFLSGKVRFGNLYISDKSCTKALPAPHFMRKLKSTDEGRDGKIVTEYDDFDRGMDTPKTLKSKHVAVSDFRKVMEVSTETQYHHTRGNDSGLYTQGSISAGQYLYGEVESSEMGLLEKLASLLESGDFRLGRSRTAQYSGCKLINSKPVDANEPAGKSGNIVFALESDAVLTDSDGVNTTDPETLKAELKIPSDKASQFNLGYKVIHGYNSKRNMRNIAVVAFAMGSTVKVEDYSVDCSEFSIGIRCSEGFGKVRVFTEEEIKTAGKVKCNAEACEEPSTDEQKDASLKAEIKAFFEHEDMSYIALRKAKQIFEANAQYFEKNCLNAAFVGAVSRMIETAGNTEEAKERVKKIKDEGKGEIIKDILAAACSEDFSDEIKREIMLSVLKLAKYRLKLQKKEGETDE